MQEILRIRIWSEGSEWRISVNEDAQTPFTFPEPFWGEYLRRGKEVDPRHTEAFGERIFRCAFNTARRLEQVDRLLEDPVAHAVDVEPPPLGPQAIGKPRQLQKHVLG